jgi:3D-(3,5/4)-trihydroxycyclohexane-1,2-dione acylhydrolase (decyclizing)
MSKTIRLTTAQAIVRFLTRQMTEIDGQKLPIFGGVWAIFGHGNVAAVGEALYEVRDTLPTFRGHNEQSMAHAAIAYAKTTFRRRMMACTSSIGPGATNMVTAAAVAHADRLPLLLLPGDVFASRLPDPVLQQIEYFQDGTISANDCFRPVSRYFDRIARPEQVIPALHRAMQVLTDPANCGPVTLALCQDTQAEAFDFPVSLFEEHVWHQRRPQPDARELATAIATLKASTKPVIIAGGGVLYSGAADALRAFAEAHAIPVMETQAGKSTLRHDHPLNVGAVGVTGASSSNALAGEADVILAVGTRLQDFTTGSWSIFKNESARIVGLNAQAFDAGKHAALLLVADAKVGLEQLEAGLAGWRAPSSWTDKAASERAAWQKSAAAVLRATNAELPSDAQVVGAVQRALGHEVIVVNASGSLPAELHKLWEAGAPGSYHLEYGYSCMGYEIAAGLGVKLARPDADVVVMVGDGAYLMANSELASAVMLGAPIKIVVVDNRGYGCINRLQMATGSANFNNLLSDTRHETLPEIDFTAHAASLGAVARKANSLAELEAGLKKPAPADRPVVFVIDTDPLPTTEAGGSWWEVAVPEVSLREEVRAARKAYEIALKQRVIA